MYLTLWTLRVSPLYVYRHFTLCLSPALDSIYYTLHVLDSMFIVTLCLSSIIIYVLLSMALYRRTRLRGNPKSCNFTSRSYTPAKGCAGTLREPQKLQLYLAFARSTMPIHAQGCASCLKVATLPRVRAARPRQSTQRVAFPIDGIGAGCGFRKKDRYTEM